MPTLTYAPFCQYQMPMAALYCRTYRQYSPDFLSEVRRAACQQHAFWAARPFRKARKWTIADVGQQGAAAYRQPASANLPAWSPFAAMCLAACQRLRRWHAYSEALA